MCVGCPVLFSNQFLFTYSFWFQSVPNFPGIGVEKVNDLNIFSGNFPEKTQNLKVFPGNFPGNPENAFSVHTWLNLVNSNHLIIISTLCCCRCRCCTLFMLSSLLHSSYCLCSCRGCILLLLLLLSSLHFVCVIVVVVIAHCFCSCRYCILFVLLSLSLLHFVALDLTLGSLTD